MLRSFSSPYWPYLLGSLFDSLVGLKGLSAGLIQCDLRLGFGTHVALLQDSLQAHLGAWD